MVTEFDTVVVQDEEKQPLPLRKVIHTVSGVRTPHERMQWLRSVLCGCLLK